MALRHVMVVPVDHSVLRCSSHTVLTGVKTVIAVLEPYVTYTVVWMRSTALLEQNSMYHVLYVLNIAPIKPYCALGQNSGARRTGVFSRHRKTAGGPSQPSAHLIYLNICAQPIRFLPSTQFRAHILINLINLVNLIQLNRHISPRWSHN